MGLDISYYSKLTPFSCSISEDGEPLNPDGSEMDYNTYHKPYKNPDFPDRFIGLEEDTFYRFDEWDHFRAGSYSGYSVWREELARIAGCPAVDDKDYPMKREASHAAGAWAATSGPFWELILFSDCEGAIGHVACQKLAKDFAEFDEKAKASEITWFYERYQEWKKAFETAADGGCVSFH